MESDTRPWGVYKVLYSDDDCKIKRITVKPGQRPSYQYHFKRNEHWIVISGNGFARVEDDNIEIKAGSVISIPIKQKHTIVNSSKSEDLVFIEIQTGTYFGEDDIIRLEDNYGRV